MRMVDTVHSGSEPFTELSAVSRLCLVTQNHVLQVITMSPKLPS